ncbi:hypothetical protein [Klebsiella grimontii]|uniref:hypothetical protein n=1 Tax=Klebsiella grimontii TaxID=2058152 RepID=UPI0015E499DD|nr:hypothetical protein [Klebsiella grimontii]QLN76063.1 hypothetical protein HV104_22530 [Klebsiella grimontii]
MTDITELTSVQKNANIHRLSRLIAYAPNDELRQMAVEVEQYTDQLIEALEKAQQERENWRTSFDNERFRAEKLAATLSNEIEQSANVRGQLLIAHKTLLNQQAKIAELESRNVKLPERYACELGYNAPDPNGDILDRDAVIDALTAAGIKWEAE